MKKSIVITAGILIVGAVVFYTYFKKEKKGEILRLHLPHQKPVELSYRWKDRKFILKAKDDYIRVHTPQRKFTFKGFVIGTGKDLDSKVKFILPENKGVVEFRYFLVRKEDSSGQLCVRIYDNGKTKKKLCFRKINSFNKRKIFFNAASGLEFFIEGEGMAIVSRPLFYSSEARDSLYIFVVAADTLRRDSLGIYNKNSTVTPNIDRFAREAVVFENAYSTAPWTLPAFASFFSGQFSHRHGISYRENTSMDKIFFLIEKLSENFNTLAITGDLFLASVYGFARGFDFYVERMDDAVNAEASKTLFAAVREELEKGAFKKQFYFLHTYQIHNTYAPEPRLVRLYYGRKLRRFRFNTMNFIRNGKALCRKVSREKREEVKSIYDAGVFTFDYRFGEFIDYLKKRGIYDNSLIVLFSDHGEEFADHGCWEHGHSLYNELIKIPLIIKFPGEEHKGKRVYANVSIVDILPTILDYCGKEWKKTDGISLLPVIKGRKLSERVLFAYLAPYSLRKHIPGKIALMKGKYKLIYNEEMKEEHRKFFLFPPVPRGKYEFYDLDIDKNERYNIRNTTIERIKLEKILQKAFNETKQRLRKKLPHDLEKKLRSIGYL